MYVIPEWVTRFPLSRLKKGNYNGNLQTQSDWETYLSHWSDSAFMFIFNVSGNPAISIPGRPSNTGLPVGIQYVARHGDEATLLLLAGQIEDCYLWRTHLPAISALAG
ncbi:amidase family protein [Sinorhizobium meliloti]|uniref:amidase family protein n=1 Tax=Rhizobium meliloti TaxID=382 RepID=UPI00398D0168